MHFPKSFRAQALFCFFLLCCGSLSSEVVRFVVPEYAPFTGTVEGKPDGIGVDIVGRVVKDLGMTMEVHVVPNFARCIAEVQSGMADGFFLGSRNEERDAIAVLSDQIMINRWVWVLPKASTIDIASKDFKTKVQIGVMLNTNPHTWLLENGYRVSSTPNSSDSLVKMIDLRRFDVALVPELVFLDALKLMGKKAADYQMLLQSEQLFGIYMSKKYLSENPGFMDRLNAAIKKGK